jgi:hypothetical protein
MTEKRPIDHRDYRLVVGILGFLDDSDDDVEPRELLELFADTPWKPATITSTIADLVNLGAVRRVQARFGRGTSRLRLTTLGRAWMDERLEPYVRPADPDAPEAPEPLP